MEYAVVWSLQQHVDYNSVCYCWLQSGSHATRDTQICLAQAHFVCCCFEQVSELKAERARLLNDKTSLHSQIAELREHYASLGLAPTTAAGHLGSLRASQEAESARSEALTRLQAAELSHERAAREWQLEKQQLQVHPVLTCLTFCLISCAWRSANTPCRQI